MSNESFDSNLITVNTEKHKNHNTVWRQIYNDRRNR